MTYNIYLPQFKALISVEETRKLFEILKQISEIEPICVAPNESFRRSLEETFPYQYYTKREIPKQPKLKLVN